jgi:hypothetical protein
MISGNKSGIAIMDRGKDGFSINCEVKNSPHNGAALYIPA